jgi:RNA polymerase sigma-70 factor (ECF subfamily)
VRSSRGRQEEWFTRLYAAHYPDIVRYGVRRLGDVDAATELAQEVFVVAWRRRGQIPVRSLPWLYGVARKLLANQWRARRRRPVEVPLDPALAAGAADADTVVAIADLRAALARLSDDDREILWLVGWERLSTSQAATVLECSPVTAAVRLHRARGRLRAALEPVAPAVAGHPAPAANS